MAKFEKGNAAGKGRIRGSRNRATLMREAISEADGKAVVRSIVTKAKKGDVAAARLVMPYIWPAGTFVKIDLPEVNDAAGIAEAQARVVAALSNEELSLEEAERLATLLENRRRALETVDIERNLRQAQDDVAALGQNAHRIAP
jgi:hypothetical protein